MAALIHGMKRTWLLIMATNYTPGTAQRPDFIDISNLNDDTKINWGEVATIGLKAVVVKVSESTTFIDDQAAAHAVGAKGIGLLVHAYHYYWGDVDNEAAFAIAKAKAAGIPQGSYLFMDFEEEKVEGDWTAQTLAFCKLVEAAGYKSGLYIGESLYTENINAASIEAAGIYVWIANYSNRPQVGHNAWQFSDKFVLAGYGEKPVDASIDFSGLLVGGGTDPNPDPDPVNPFQPPKRPKIEPGAYVSVKKTSAYSPNGEDLIQVIAPDGVHLQDYDLWEISQKIVYENIRLISPNGAVFLLSVDDNGQLITRKEVKNK